MKELLKQIRTDKFKPSNYTVYNMIDDNGYVDELRGMFKEEYNIDDFEYMFFDLSISEKNAIFYRMSCVLNIFRDIKYLVEHELQDDKDKSKARMYIDKDKSTVMIVKLKEFKLVERVEKMIKNSELINS